MVDGRAIIDFPPLDIVAPLTKSTCPPGPLNSFELIYSAFTCPVKSTSIAELIEIILSF